MATLRLFRGVEWDGVNVFPLVDSTLDSRLASKVHYAKHVDFIRIGEPLLVDMNHGDAVGYAYGDLTVDGVKYFLTITSIEVKKQTAVYLHYTVDWFTTLAYRENLEIGRCHMIRSSDVDPRFYEQPIQPTDMRIGSISKLEQYGSGYYGGNADNPMFWKIMDSFDNYVIISYMVDATQEIICTPVEIDFYTDVDSGDSLRNMGLRDVQTGEFTSLLGIAPQDITGIWITPVKPTVHHVQMKTNTVGDNTPVFWLRLSGLSTTPKIKVNGLNFTPTEMKQYYVMDNMENVLYQIPKGRTLKEFVIKSRITLASCEVVFYPIFTDTADSDDLFTLGKSMLENSSFTLICPQVDFINDTYKNWATGLRGVEIEERRIQRNKALTQGIGGSALTGALGATAGPVGAVAGLAGGLGGAFLSYGVDTYYESATQELEDKKYQSMPDTPMSGTYSVETDYGGLSIVELKARSEDVARYNAEISNYGAKCNLPLGGWTPRVGVYKFGDVEIKADAPYDVKNSIREKLQKGVRIIK